MGTSPERLTAQNFYPYDGAKKPSWLLIIVMFIFFFPVGIYLLHKRLKITRGLNSAATVTYAWSILGAVSSFFAILGGGGIVAWVMLAVFGFAFLVGMGEGVQWREYNSYISIFMSGEWYLPYIAEAIGKEQKAVVSDLNDMFSEGIFAGSYIDMAALTVEVDYSCLAKMGLDAPKLKKIYVQDADPAFTAPKKTVVRCNGCGANVEGIVGQTASCEFCGSPIYFS